jgi:HAD superfamily hydrolase (TIGR01509 family)
MLEAVIFDMDGVIVDSHPVHREAWRTFLRALDRPVSEAELDFVLDGRKRGEILRHFFGELSEAAMREYGERKDEYFRQASLQVKPVPGVLKFMRMLAHGGVALGVATSASRSRTRNTLQNLGLLKQIRAIVTGDDVALGKPDPSIYARACAELKVVPGNALAVEDAVSGIQAARGAGLHCIGVASHQSPSKLKEAGAVHVVRDFLKLSMPRLERCLVPAPGPSRRGPTARTLQRSLSARPGACSA